MAVYMYMSIRLFFCFMVFRCNKVKAVFAVQGSSVQLQCPYRVNDSEGKRISWSRKDDGMIYTIGIDINSFLQSELISRLKVTGDHTAGEYHLSISNVRRSDEGNYECSLSGTTGALALLKLTVSVPETPGNFSIRTTSTTSITIVWDPNSGGGHTQAFYIQYRVQGSLSWTTVSAGEEGINEQKRRRTYELKNLQERQTYELRMFSENTAGKRSNYTEIWLTLTKSSGIPETPGNFSMKTTSTTSITIVWDSNSGGRHSQTFYIQYRVQGSSKWNTISAGKEGINEQKRRRTYELKNLQVKQTYELRMFSENIAVRRSNYTEVLSALTKSSEILTSSSIVIGGVVGAVVTVGIVCASVMGIVFFKRRKGQDQTEKNDTSHENTGFHERQKENEYEEVGNKCDVQQKESSQTYESLGIKATLNVYDDLENPKGLILSKSSMGLYEALGNQDKPSIYSALQNQKEQTQLIKQPTETDIRKASNNSKENRELYTNQRPIENVYDNEGF